MKFKLPSPEDLAALSLEELAALKAEAVAERTEIANLADEKLGKAELDAFDEIVDAIETIDARSAELDAEATSRDERVAAMRAALETEGDDEPGEDPGDNPEDVVVPDDASELEEEPVAITASARRGAAAKAARRAPKPVDDPGSALNAAPKVALTASANVPDFDNGQSLADFREVAEAFQSRSKGWARSISVAEAKAKPRVIELSSSMTKHKVARIDKREGSSEFTVDQSMSTAEQFDVIMKAASERGRFGKLGGLVAAGGWCAPSETIYDGFLRLETVSGILDLPTVNADRGGISFTKGPDYSTIAATWGFMQTEAQAEAGTAKVCYPVACPPFAEVRLDAIGFCITAGILTEAAYPELIDRVLEIGAVAHAHKVNASVISRILAYVGAAVDHAEIGATTSDVLDAAVIQATRLRYTYAMAPEATIESFFPVWALEIFRSDLSRRNGVEMLEITRADVERFFSVRGIAVQWVYDWQNFTAANSGTWTSLPDVLEFVMYPAGSFVKLGTNVIDLSTIYDSVNTSTNTYTAAFFEEGLAVANTGATGVRVAVDVSQLYGQTGAANLGTALPVVIP